MKSFTFTIFDKVITCLNSNNKVINSENYTACTNILNMITKTSRIIFWCEFKSQIDELSCNLIKLDYNNIYLYEPKMNRKQNHIDNRKQKLPKGLKPKQFGVFLSKIQSKSGANFNISHIEFGKSNENIRNSCYYKLIDWLKS